MSERGAHILRLLFSFWVYLLNRAGPLQNDENLHFDTIKSILIFLTTLGQDIDWDRLDVRKLQVGYVVRLRLCQIFGKSRRVQSSILILKEWVIWQGEANVCLGRDLRGGCKGIFLRLLFIILGFFLVGIFLTKKCLEIKIIIKWILPGWQGNGIHWGSWQVKFCSIYSFSGVEIFVEERKDRHKSFLDFLLRVFKFCVHKCTSLEMISILDYPQWERSRHLRFILKLILRRLLLLFLIFIVRPSVNFQTSLSAFVSIDKWVLMCAEHIVSWVPHLSVCIVQIVDVDVLWHMSET